jgi:hypothetical protein
MGYLPLSLETYLAVCYLYQTTEKIRRARKHMNANVCLVLIMLLVLLF